MFGFIMSSRRVVIGSLITLTLLLGCDAPPSVPVVPESDAGTPASNTNINPLIKATSNTPPGSIDKTPPTAADADAVAQMSHIMYGMNIGNYMDQPGQPTNANASQCSLSGPPSEGAGAGGGKLGGWMFEAIKQAGFDHVRLTVNWNCHTGHDAGAGATDIDTAWFARIDWAIAHVLTRGMVLVLDMHNNWDYFNKLPGEREKLVSMWAQIAEHYKDYPKQLYLEILNEPPYGFDTAQWGQDLAACIQAVRASNPYRTIVYGGTDFNKAYTLPALDTYLPTDDKNLIATVHYYSPYCFTHGQTWDCTRTYGTAYDSTKPNVQWPSPYTAAEADAGDAVADKMVALVKSDFDATQQTSTQIGRPIYVGEFGAMGTRDLQSRGAYTAAVVQAAEQRGMAWADWGFVNTQFDAWNGAVGWYPPIISALRPEYTVPTN